MAHSNVGLIRDFFNRIDSGSISEKDTEIAIEGALIDNGKIDEDEGKFLMKRASQFFPKLKAQVLQRNQFTNPLDRLKEESASFPSLDHQHTILFARLIVEKMKSVEDADQLVKFVNEYPQVAKSVVNLLKEKKLDSVYFSQYIKISLTYAETLQPKSRAEGTSFTVQETIFSNPYAWLGVDSQDTRLWVEQQSRATNVFLNNIPGYTDVESFVRANYSPSTFPVPQVSRGYVFYLQSGAKSDESPRLYRKKIDSNDNPELVFELTTSENDEHDILSEFLISPDGDKVMVKISRGGRDHKTLKVFDINDPTKITDEIPGIKNTSIAWKPDGAGFYYSTYHDKQGRSYPNTEGLLYHQVYFHKFKSSAAQDTLVYKSDHLKDQKGIYFLSTTKDGKGLLLTIKGTQEKEKGIYYRPIDSKEEFKLLIKTDPTETYNIIGANDEGGLILYTTEKAPNGKVVLIDPKNPKATWKSLVPERRETIFSAVTAGGKIIVHYIENIFSRVKVYNSNGKFEKDISLPPHVCVMDRSNFSYFSGESSDTKVVALISNPIMPPQLVVANVMDGTVAPLLKSAPAKDNPNSLNFSDYVVEILKVKRPDQTEVIGTFIHLKNAKPNGNMPILIDGYMGFKQSYTPWFENKYLPILKSKGGILIVHGRGGGEFGQQQYLDGIKENGNNGALDVIIMAQGLVDLKWTLPGKIIVNGSSHGGLVMASAALQKPELLRYAIPAEALLNPLYAIYSDKHTNIGYWKDTQYGDPKTNEKVLKAMADYSPTQLALRVDKNLLSQQVFFLPTPRNDERVLSGDNVYPFVAAVQQRNGHALLGIYQDSGHGDNLNESDIRNIIDNTAFYLAMIGINPKKVFKK